MVTNILSLTKHGKKGLEPLKIIEPHCNTHPQSHINHFLCITIRTNKIKKTLQKKKSCCRHKVLSKTKTVC